MRRPSGSKRVRNTVNESLKDLIRRQRDREIPRMARQRVYAGMSVRRVRC